MGDIYKVGKEEEDIYTVEKNLNCRNKRGRREYLIKWKDYKE